MERSGWTAFVGVALACSACGGADVPEHDGYRRGVSRPWRQPTVLRLDDSREAEVDDTVSYPKRQRARWYAIDLPASGTMEVQVSAAELSEDREEVDVAFEVLDEGYRVRVRADAKADDAGDELKVRRLRRLAPGRYYIHVYAQRRVDEADYTLEVSFRPQGGKSARSDFPAQVAYIDPLPQVPEQDDSPAPPPPAGKKCPGPGCKKKAQVEEPPPAAPKSIRARIAGIVESGGTVQIRIDQGANQGIEVGWKGMVVSRDGKAIAGGTFEVSRVSPSESFAVVRSSPSSVTAAKYVRLRPP
jgi:hypothetical protein